MLQSFIVQVHTMTLSFLLLTIVCAQAYQCMTAHTNSNTHNHTETLRLSPLRRLRWWPSVLWPTSIDRWWHLHILELGSRFPSFSTMGYIWIRLQCQIGWIRALEYGRHHTWHERLPITVQHWPFWTVDNVRSMDSSHRLRLAILWYRPFHTNLIL